MAVVWPSKNNFANGDVLTAANMNNIADTLNVFNPTSATNGQVLTANGSGSASFQNPSGGMTVLSTGSLTSGTLLDLTNISQDYIDLNLRIFGLKFSASGDLRIDVGGASVTTATFNWWNYWNDPGGNTSGSGDSNSTTEWTLNWQYGIEQTTANNFFDVRFLSYARTNRIKVATANSHFQYGTNTYANVFATTGIDMQSSVAIDKIRITTGTAVTFSAGTYILYGVK